MNTEKGRPVRLPPLAALALFMASCAGHDHVHDHDHHYVAEPTVFFYGGYYHGRYYERGYYRYYDDRGYYDYYGPTPPAPPPAESSSRRVIVAPAATASPSVKVAPGSPPAPLRLRKKRIP